MAKFDQNYSSHGFQKDELVRLAQDVGSLRKGELVHVGGIPDNDGNCSVWRPGETEKHTVSAGFLVRRG